MKTPLSLTFASLVALVALAGCSGAEVTEADGKDDVASTAGPSDTPATEETEEVDPNLPTEDDVRVLIDGLASEAVGPMQKGLRTTQPGSAAHGYLSYLIQGEDARIDGGYPAQAAGTVNEKKDKWEICYFEADEAPCYTYANFEGSQGEIVDFTVNGKPIGPRLVVGNGKATPGTNGLQGTFVAGFESSDGESLIIGYQLRTRDAAFVTEVTYRSPEGRQSTSVNYNGPSDLGADSMANFQAIFTGAKLGGVVTVNLYGETSSVDYSVSFDTAAAKS